MEKTASQRGKSSKQKGKRGEKEVIEILTGALNELSSLVDTHKLPILRQSATAKGHDLNGVEGLAIEVKRQETLHLDKWWQQASEQAELMLKKTGRTHQPVLIYKQNRKAWRVRMQVQLPYENGVHFVIGEISMEDFLRWFKSHVVYYYK